MAAVGESSDFEICGHLLSGRLPVAYKDAHSHHAHSIQEQLQIRKFNFYRPPRRSSLRVPAKIASCLAGHDSTLVRQRASGATSSFAVGDSGLSANGGRGLMLSHRCINLSGGDMTLNPYFPARHHVESYTRHLIEHTPVIRQG